MCWENFKTVQKSAEEILVCIRLYIVWYCPLPELNIKPNLKMLLKIFWHLKLTSYLHWNSILISSIHYRRPEVIWMAKRITFHLAAKKTLTKSTHNSTKIRVITLWIWDPSNYSNFDKGCVCVYLKTLESFRGLCGLWSYNRWESLVFASGHFKSVNITKVSLVVGSVLIHT